MSARIHTVIPKTAELRCTRALAHKHHCHKCWLYAGLPKIQCVTAVDPQDRRSLAEACFLLHKTSRLEEPHLTCGWSLGPWWYSGSWKSRSVQLSTLSSYSLRIDLHCMSDPYATEASNLSTHQWGDTETALLQCFTYILYMHKWSFFRFCVIRFWTHRNTSAQCVRSFTPPYRRDANSLNSDFNGCMCASSPLCRTWLSWVCL